MRNRVAGFRGLVRICVVLVLVPAVLVMAGQTASAADDVAVSSMPFPIGPVGIAVVAVGFGGLVAGLVRHRRRLIAAPAVAEPEPVVPEQHAA